MRLCAWIFIFIVLVASQAHAAEPPILPIATPTAMLVADEYTGLTAISELRLATDGVLWTGSIDRTNMVNADAWITRTVEISRDYGDTWTLLCKSTTRGGVIPGWNGLPSSQSCDLGTPATALTLVRGSVHVYQCASVDGLGQCVGPSDASETLAYTVRVD
jgi:hypothetical protein